MISAQFLLTSLIVVLIPGTGALYTISAGIAGGRRSGIAAAFGRTLGIVPHLVASVLGLSAIMNMSAQVFSVVKLAGAAYLLFLAWQMWKDTGAIELEGRSAERGALATVGRAIALNLLNPKLRSSSWPSSRTSSFAGRCRPRASSCRWRSSSCS